MNSKIILGSFFFGVSLAYTIMANPKVIPDFKNHQEIYGRRFELIIDAKDREFDDEVYLQYLENSIKNFNIDIRNVTFNKKLGINVNSDIMSSGFFKTMILNNICNDSCILKFDRVRESQTHAIFISNNYNFNILFRRVTLAEYSIGVRNNVTIEGNNVKFLIIRNCFFLHENIIIKNNTITNLIITNNNFENANLFCENNMIENIYISGNKIDCNYSSNMNYSEETEKVIVGQKWFDKYWDGFKPPIPPPVPKPDTVIPTKAKIPTIIPNMISNKIRSYIPTILLIIFLILILLILYPILKKKLTSDTLCILPYWVIGTVTYTQFRNEK
ncbi:hypothetical protein [Carp edema virus]|nr:hypothetical protein [Carp edema virus]